MNFASIKNVAINAANPKYLTEMLRKLSARFSERYDANELQAYCDHCAKNQVDADAWARRIDSQLWEEAIAFGQAHKVHSDQVMASLPVQMGGGGFYHLLYFLTRLTQPKIIVETGVAAGYSSRAFLKAVQANGDGKLVSSDFPYFRLENPEQYIGVLVEEELKPLWDLHIGSDRTNIPKIAGQYPKIDLLHYDSDKTVAGRQFALDQFALCFHKDTLIIFDDIQDNLHFRDFVARGQKQHLIFEFGGKYIGLVIPENQPGWA